MRNEEWEERSYTTDFFTLLFYTRIAIFSLPSTKDIRSIYEGYTKDIRRINLSCSSPEYDFKTPTDSLKVWLSYEEGYCMVRIIVGVFLTCEFWRGRFLPLLLLLRHNL